MAGGASRQAFGLLISVWPIKDTRQVFLDSDWALSNFSHWFATKQTRSLSAQRALRGLDMDKLRAAAAAAARPRIQIPAALTTAHQLLASVHLIRVTLQQKPFGISGRWGWERRLQAAWHFFFFPQPFPMQVMQQGKSDRRILNFSIRTCLFTKSK